MSVLGYVMGMWIFFSAIALFCCIIELYQIRKRKKKKLFTAGPCTVNAISGEIFGVGGAGGSGASKNCGGAGGYGSPVGYPIVEYYDYKGKRY